MADDFLKSLVPMIGNALAGPFGGVAASFVASKLGLDSKDVKAVQDVLTSGSMTPEQIANLKLAELDMQKFMADNEIKKEQLVVDDRKSARDMQALTRSYMPAFLAVTVTFGFFGILAALMYGGVEKTDEVMIMLGSLGTAWTGIISFYFGSSSGSQNKDLMLHQSTPMK